MNTIRKATIALSIGMLLYLAFGLYSMSWGERILRPVAKGMTQNNVRSLIGSPVEEIHRGNGTTAWNYSRWFGTDAIVYFDTSGVVSAKETD